MKFVPSRHRERSLAIEITPMIDVVFLLIIFFMTTAQFARMTRADVELPLEKGEQLSIPEEAGIVINITGAGELIVSDRTVSAQELEQIVRSEIRRGSERPVQLKFLIRADRNAPAGQLNRVVSLLESLGVGSARLATEVPR